MENVLSKEDWENEPSEELLERDFYVTCSERLLGDLFEDIDNMTKDISDEFFVRATAVYDGNIYIEILRNETYEEYVKRVTSHERWKKEVQKKADKTWARQKRKFQMARK
jgi:hypothetical protein